jgi:hypothetical protein
MHDRASGPRPAAAEDYRAAWTDDDGDDDIPPLRLTTAAG